MEQDAEDQEQDFYTAPDGPVFEIFEIGLRSVARIVHVHGRAAEAADLREAGQPGLGGMAVWLHGGMAMPVALVDFPKQRVGGARPEQVRARAGARANNAHVAPQNASNCGSSSMLVLRQILPTRVILSSLREVDRAPS